MPPLSYMEIDSPVVCYWEPPLRISTPVLDRDKMLEATPTREVEAPPWVQRWPQL
jgi:hypothetical protein